MQSTPTLKETDPHDVFAIESLLAAHAEKAPPLAHEPAAPSVAPQVQVVAQPQAAVPPQISVSAPIPQVEPDFRAPDVSDIQFGNVRPSEIKVDGLKPHGERPMPKWVKRAVMALLALFGAIAAAAWQHYGDQATAMAAEWAPPFVLAALPSAAKSAMAEQPSAPAETAASSQTAVQQPAAVAAVPSQPEPAAAATSAESSQLQSMAQDLALMGQQVEELKTTIAQLKASQAQMTREFAKASEARVSEAKAAETKPVEHSPRPRVSALTPPAPRPAAPPPVRKPKPVSSYSPAYSPPPLAAAPAAPLPPVQAAAPLPSAPPQQTMADDGAPVVRPPMPLR